MGSQDNWESISVVASHSVFSVKILTFLNLNLIVS